MATERLHWPSQQVIKNCDVPGVCLSKLGVVAGGGVTLRPGSQPGRLPAAVSIAAPTKPFFRRRELDLLSGTRRCSYF